MLRGKRNWIVITVAVLALSVGSLQADFEDDMEDGIGNWSPDTSIISEETTNLGPNSGSKALRIENLAPLGIVGTAFSTGGDPGGNNVYFPVIGGAEYTFSFDYYAIDNAVYYGIYIFPEEGEGGGTAAADFGWTQNAWDTYSYTFTTIDNAFDGYMGFFPTGEFGTIIIDNVSLTTDAVTLLPGDANRDGQVSAGDYASVQANFGNVGAENDPELFGDANPDFSPVV